MRSQFRGGSWCAHEGGGRGGGSTFILHSTVTRVCTSYVTCSIKPECVLCHALLQYRQQNCYRQSNVILRPPTSHYVSGVRLRYSVCNNSVACSAITCNIACAFTFYVLCNVSSTYSPYSVLVAKYVQPATGLSILI